MKMRESEVFTNYIKLAQDAGLISEEDGIEKKADADTKTRYDSNSFSDIEALYGHKFEPNKEKDESIVEVAHPETMVVGPAYDAMNAVVENLHQRQDIMSYVALKDPDGQLVQRRYVAAADDLTKTLVSTAFALDADSEEELMKLADSCAGRLTAKADGKLEKNAMPWGILIPLAISVVPEIFNYVVGKTVQDSATKKGVNPSTARRMASITKQRTARAFGRLGLGVVAFQTFRMIMNRLPDWDTGVQNDSEKVIQGLGELASVSEFRGHINDFKAKVQKVRATHGALASHMKSANNRNADVKYYTPFVQAYSEMQAAQSAYFDQLLANMNVDVSNFTGTETEEEIRRADEAASASGIRNEVERSLAALNTSANKFISNFETAHPEVQAEVAKEQGEVQKVEAATAQAAEAATEDIAQIAEKNPGLSVQQALEVSKARERELEERLANLEKLLAQQGMNVG